MKKITTFLALTILISCRSQIATIQTIPEPIEILEAKKIIASHYNNKLDFSTLYIKANVKYRDSKQTQNLTAEIKIKKNEQIMISIRFLGITMAKASITPANVSYYEKLNGTYFEGDYSMLSQWLGTDLDFTKIQNMLVGETLDDLQLGNYAKTHSDNLYKLVNTDSLATKKCFYINPADFSLSKQEIEQPEKTRKIEINYSDIKEFSSLLIPTNILINAIQANDTTEISINYNTVIRNEELSFPYTIPDGYNKIIIK